MVDGWNLRTNKRINGKGDSRMVRPQEGCRKQVCEPSPKRVTGGKEVQCTACLMGCQIRRNGWTDKLSPSAICNNKCALKMAVSTCIYF